MNSFWQWLANLRERRSRRRFQAASKRANKVVVDAARRYVKQRLQAVTQEKASVEAELARAREAIDRQLAVTAAAEYRGERLQREIEILQREIELMAATIHAETERHRANAEIERIKTAAMRSNLPGEYP